MLKLRFDDIQKNNLKRVLKSKPNLKCDKHIRFNPANGRGSIVGACVHCEQSFSAYQAYLNLRQALAVYVAEVILPFETVKPRTKKVTE